MIESLIIAGLTGLVTGALLLGMTRGEVRANTAAIEALHARFDGFVLAMMQHGLIDAGAIEHLARHNKIEVKHEQRRR